MNILSITLEQVVAGDGNSYPSIQISIDGMKLQELAKNHELPFAQREGHPDIAGGYLGLDVEATNRNIFLGEAEFDYGEDSNKVALMECVCGCPGCWPLAVRITKTSNTVLWSDFEQPHRGPDSAGGHWDYTGFGPFEFDLEQYLNEIAKLSERAEPSGSANPPTAGG
jgi:hypothetical protein